MQKVAVIGAGTMGQGIAQVAAQAGYQVWLYDAFPKALVAAKAQLKEVLEMLERKHRLDSSAQDVLQRLHFTDALSELSNGDLVIEAVPERLDLKQTIFTELDRLLPDAILATNTSTLSVTSVASVTERPERVLGLHFFNPAPLMKLVEVIPGLATDPELTQKAAQFIETLGKTPVTAKDAPGFIVNRVARAFYSEALYLHNEGISTEMIDGIMRGLGFRMGPFELMDLIGIDVNYAAAKSVYEAFFHAPRFRPHPIQRRMVEAGRLGRKTGRGFYRYPREAEKEPPSQGPKELSKAFWVGSKGELEPYNALSQATTDKASLRVELRPQPFSGLSRAKEVASTPVAYQLLGSSASLDSVHSVKNAVWFNLVLPLAQVRVAELYVPLGREKTEAFERARAYFEAQGFRVELMPDTPGGVGLRILVMIINEAVSALAEGLATIKDIDTAMKLGTNYPLGPFEWSEHMGIATVYATLYDLHKYLGERYRPHPLLAHAAAVGLKGWEAL